MSGRAGEKSGGCSAGGRKNAILHARRLSQACRCEFDAVFVFATFHRAIF